MSLAVSDPGTYLATLPVPSSAEEPSVQRGPRPLIRVVRSVDCLERAIATSMPATPTDNAATATEVAVPFSTLPPEAPVKVESVTNALIKESPLMSKASSSGSLNTKKLGSHSIEKLLAADRPSSVVKVVSDPLLDPLFEADDIERAEKNPSPAPPPVAIASSRRKTKAWGKGRPFSFLHASFYLTII